MTQLLTSLAQGRVAILLEGGYNLESISYSMTMCAKALLGDPLPSPRIDSPSPAAVSTIQRVVNHLRKYWSSLRFHVDLPDPEDVIRTAQAVEKAHSLEEQLEQLQLNSDLEASGCSAVEEPKTLQEFLLLPENIQAMNEGTFFSVIPRQSCPHLEEHVRPDDGHVQWSLQTPCAYCQDGSENWVCLSCYQVTQTFHPSVNFLR